MNLIITDNPNFHDKSNSESLLLYQIFDWRIKVKELDFEIIDSNDLNIDNEETFELKKRFKKGLYRKKIQLNPNIIAIVSPSNYKLIFELIHIAGIYNKNLTFYTWDGWPARKEFFVDAEKIKKLFFNYIQRGYLTKISYQDLEYFNMQRIEQFIIVAAIAIGGKHIKTNDYGFVKAKFFKDSDTSLSLLIQKLLLKNKSVYKTVDKLMYNSRKNEINDPFTGALKFRKVPKNSIKKQFDLIEFSDIEKFDSNDNYLDSNPINVFSISLLLKDIMPLTDILKTIRFLEKNDLISSGNENGILTLKEYIEFDFLKYKAYIDSKLWKRIYLSESYVFSDTFPKINIVPLAYHCPICGSTSFRMTPKHFYCSDISCKLYVNRLIKPGGIVKQVTDIEFIRLINHGSTVIKNKIGGYNRFMLYKNDKQVKIIPQIEKSIVLKSSEED